MIRDILAAFVSMFTTRADRKAGVRL